LRWVVTRIDGSAPLRGATLRADFGVDGRVNGDSGCNSFSGPYIQTGNTVQIGEPLSTRRACVDNDRQRQETHLLAILQGATSARLEHGQLNLRGADGTLVLAPGSTDVADTAYAYPKNVQFDCQGTGLSVRFETGQAHLTWRDTHGAQLPGTALTASPHSS
jgi:heat shock protein HslJ